MGNLCVKLLAKSTQHYRTNSYDVRYVCLTDNIIFTDENFDRISKDQFISTSSSNGFYSVWYDKNICFNPTKITDINFCHGSHCANPQGQVNQINAGLCLHYKHTGIKYLSKRHLEVRSRMSKFNLDRGYAIHFMKDPKEVYGEVYDKYQNQEIWRDIFPNHSKFRFNEQECIVTNISYCEWIKEMLIMFKPEIFINFDRDIYSCLAKFLGIQFIYDSNKNINGWNNVKLISQYKDNYKRTLIKTNETNPLNSEYLKMGFKKLKYDNENVILLK